LPSQGILLAGLVEPYLESRRPHLVATVLEQEGRFLKRFIDFLSTQDVVELGAIAEEHVARYLVELRSLPGRRGPVSDSFLQQAMQAVRTFLVWARKSGLLLEDFSQLPIPKRVDRVRQVPTEDEMRRLLELSNQDEPLGARDRLLLELLYVLGLRAGECAGLDLGSIDLVARTLSVVGKGGHKRLLPLSPKLYEVLVRYLEQARPRLAGADEQALLVGSTTGRRLEVQSVRRRVRAYGKRLGLSLHPHQLRHACATHLLEGGADPIYIARLLGHERLCTTSRYARVRNRELWLEHRRCHPRALGSK
jgi:site-specific recombinase XerD